MQPLGQLPSSWLLISSAPLRLHPAVELKDAQAGAHAAQLRHALRALLHRGRLVGEQVAL